MNFYIPRAELEKALKELDAASENGFAESQAVFQFARVDKEDQFSKIVCLDVPRHAADSPFEHAFIVVSLPCYLPI